MKKIVFSIFCIAIYAVIGVNSKLFAYTAPSQTYHEGHRFDDSKHISDHYNFSPSSSAPVPLTKKFSSIRNQVTGFLPYWYLSGCSNGTASDMSACYQNYNYSVLSTIIYFGITVDGNGNFITSQSDYQGFASSDFTSMENTAHSNGVKVILTIKTFNTTNIESIVNNSSNWQNLINNIVDLEKTYKLDGVDIDFENGPSDTTTMNNFSSFINNLTGTLHYNIPGSLVYVSTYASAARWPTGFYDIKALGSDSDGLDIMAYDFYYTGSSTTGPTAPLYGFSQGKYWYDISTAIQDYKALVSPSKILLGIPYYGYDWPTQDLNPNTSVITNLQSGMSGPFADTYVGMTDQYNNSSTNHWDSVADTPWYGYCWGLNGTSSTPMANPPCPSGYYNREAYYDDATSLSLKYQYAVNNQVGGIAIWVLGDDNNNSTLWSTISSNFLNTTNCSTIPESDNLVVTFNSSVSEQQASNISSKYSACVDYIGDIEGSQVYKLAKPTGITLTQFQQTLQSDGNIVRTEDNTAKHFSSLPNDAQIGQQWNLNLINAPVVDNNGFTTSVGGSTSTIIAVLDSGVATENYTDPITNTSYSQAPDLSSTTFVSPYNAIAFENNQTANISHPFDDIGHGTAVTGVIAASTNNDSSGLSQYATAGIAFNTSIMPIKVGDAVNGVTLAAELAGIQWAEQHGANVINLSFEGDFSQTEENAIEGAVNDGITVVAATGNDNSPTLMYPAGYANVIAVGAVNHDLTRSSYSNYGCTQYNCLTTNAPVGDNNSPSSYMGVWQQTYPGFNYGQTITSFSSFTNENLEGTSFAAPQVAAAAGLLYATGITSPQSIKNMIVQYSSKIPGTICGNGLECNYINIGSLVNAGTSSVLTSNNTYDTYQNTLTISGTKPSSITSISINGSTTGVTITDSTHWQAQISLTSLNINTFNIYGTDGTGTNTTTSTIQISKHSMSDINGDGKVDLSDYSMLVRDWLKTGNLLYPLTDMDNDGKVDITDLSIFARYYVG